MKLPKAYVSHRTDHRLRIRIPSRRGSAEYFSEMERKLERLEGVESVRTNSLTGSVLLTTRHPWVKLGDFARGHRLFVLSELPKPDETDHRLIVVHLARGIQRLDRRVHRATGGRLDLASLRIFGLLGIAGYQLKKGKLFPPAYTLIEGALGSLRALQPVKTRKKRVAPPGEVIPFAPKKAR